MSKPDTCAVHSSLLGRWALGGWRESNPAYVPTYERKRKQVYPPEADDAYLWHTVTEPIVAVPIDETYYGESWLKIWVLVEGKPRWLGYGAVVMPAGWTPNAR